MKAFFTSILIVLCINGSVLANPTKETVEAIRKKYNLPALGGGEFKEGVISKIGSSGVRKLGSPTLVTNNDKWHIGSCTKSMTATVAAILMEKGNLDFSWKTKMVEVFDDFEIHEDFKNATIEMLFAHRSGVTNDITTVNNGSLWEKLWDTTLDPKEGRALVAKAILSQKRSHDPDGKMEYSNAGYIIAGAVLEKLTGISWEALMKEKLFSPLEMYSCGFGPPASPSLEEPDQPWGHVFEDSNIIPVPPGLNADNPKTLGPAGTVHCSMSDWLKYLSIHIEGFNRKDTLILSAEGFKKLHSDYRGQGYSVGGWVVGRRSWAKGTVLSHGGSNSMNLAVVFVAPKINASYIAVTNYADTDDPEHAVDELLKFLIF